MLRKALQAKTVALAVIAAAGLAVAMPAGNAAATQAVPCDNDAYLWIHSAQNKDHCYKSGGEPAVRNVYIDAEAVKTGTHNATLTFSDGSTRDVPYNSGVVHVNRLITGVQVH